MCSDSLSRPAQAERLWQSRLGGQVKTIDGTSIRASRRQPDSAEHRRLGASFRGTFAGVPRPEHKGDPGVEFANRDLARRARIAEREWKRSLRRRRTK